MSIRASLFSFFVRHTIKKAFANYDDPQPLRNRQGTPQKLPEEIIIDPIEEIEGLTGEWVSWPGVSEESVVLYFHGGGYVFGSPDSRREMAWRVCQQAGVKMLLAGYRLAPENPFPAPVEDATRWYRWLLDKGYKAENIGVMGDSAGGGLSVALMVNLKNLGLPLPKAAVLMSPWVDMTASGLSMQTNNKADPMLTAATIGKFAANYIAEHDPRAPLASPLFADLSGLPSTYVIAGSTEVLLSDSERLVEAINEAGGHAELVVWKKMLHVFPTFPEQIPEAKQAITQMSEFLVEVMGTRPAG